MQAETPGMLPKVMILIENKKKKGLNHEAEIS